MAERPVASALRRTRVNGAMRRPVRTGTDTAVRTGTEERARSSARRSRHRHPHEAHRQCAEATADAGAAGKVERGRRGDGGRRAK